MNTLTTEPLAAVLARLFAEADASTAVLRREMGKLSPEERVTMMTTTTEYRAFYARAKDLPLAVSRETGTLLYRRARPEPGTLSSSGPRSASRRSILPQPYATMAAAD